jgi:hypothetical protein
LRNIKLSELSMRMIAVKDKTAKWSSNSIEDLDCPARE